MPNVSKIQGIRLASGEDLDPIPFNMLSWLHARWITSVGDRPLSFSLVGRDLLIVRPGVLAPTTVTVFYKPIFPAFANEATLFSVPDEDVDMITDIAEALLLLKARDYQNLQPVLDRLGRNITETIRTLR